MYFNAGLKQSRRLRDGELTLRVGNGARVAAVAVGTYSLCLPTGVVLELRDCLYVPSATRNLISISRLVMDGYKFIFESNVCSIYLRNNLIGYGSLIDNLYHLHMDVSVNTVDNGMNENIIGFKRPREEVNKTYLWHLRLGNIREDRINKLAKNGVLGSLPSEPYPACESCL